MNEKTKFFQHQGIYFIAPENSLRGAGLEFFEGFIFLALHFVI